MTRANNPPTPPESTKTAISNDDIETMFFEEGTILFEEHEVSFHFFIIQEGEVEVFKTGPNGPVTLAKLGPGNSLGEFAMLDRQARSASARALTPLTVAKVSPEAYDQLLEELPDWAVSVMRALVERLRFTNEIVKTLQKSNAGSLNVADRQALQSAEFDSESRVARIRAAEDRADASDATDTNFDFSVYESNSSKPKKTR